MISWGTGTVPVQVLATLIIGCALACLYGAAGFLVVYTFTAEAPLLLIGVGIGGLSGVIAAALTLP